MRRADAPAAATSTRITSPQDPILDCAATTRAGHSRARRSGAAFCSTYFSAPDLFGSLPLRRLVHDGFLNAATRQKDLTMTTTSTYRIGPDDLSESDDRIHSLLRDPSIDHITSAACHLWLAGQESPVLDHEAAGRIICDQINDRNRDDFVAHDDGHRRLGAAAPRPTIQRRGSSELSQSAPHDRPDH